MLKQIRHLVFLLVVVGIPATFIWLLLLVNTLYANRIADSHVGLMRVVDVLVFFAPPLLLVFSLATKKATPKVGSPDLR